MEKSLQICSDYRDGRLFEYLFHQLEEYGESLDVYYYCPKNQEDFPKSRELIVHPSFHPWERPFYFLKYHHVYQGMIRRIDPYSYDISHGHSLMSNGYLSYRLWKDYQIPYLLAVRNTDTFVFFKVKPYLRPLGLRIMKNASGIVFLSPKSRDYTFSFFPKSQEALQKKSYIIPNGIDEMYFQNTRGKRIIDRIRLCFIALNVEEKIKNYPMVFKVFERLYQKDSRFEMIVIGNASSKYQKRFYHPKITYKGPLEKEEVLKELEQAHIYLMPSLRETFGLVYVEAMSQGLPVIYTKSQGFDGQFKEGEIGFGVQGNDPNEIIDKIFRILKDYPKMSQRAVESARKFNWKDIGKEYIELYDRIRREKR